MVHESPGVTLEASELAYPAPRLQLHNWVSKPLAHPLINTTSPRAMPVTELTGLLLGLLRYCNLALQFFAVSNPLYDPGKGTPQGAGLFLSFRKPGVSNNSSSNGSSTDNDTKNLAKEMATPKHATHKSLLPSHEFYLAAGTVTVDRRTRRALVLHDRLTGLHGLPRGRADWGESLTSTAVRETLEEGGVRCALLPVPVPTRATPPPGRTSPASSLSPSPRLVASSGSGTPEPMLSSTEDYHRSHYSSNPIAAADPDDDDEIRDEVGEVTKGVLLTEPFALLTHFRSNGALAVVHWFVAEADSAVPFEEGGQMADEDYEPRWVGFDEAARLMPDSNHADVVSRAVRLVDRLEAMERRGEIAVSC
ncbi:hypothetical protein RB598_009424 [Gaeumannomyces tritici]